MGLSKNNEFLKEQLKNIGDGFISDTTIQNIGLKVWNKRKNKRELLAESISTITLGKFVVKSDTFWLPILQTTRTRLLDGVFYLNSFNFLSEVTEDDQLETDLYLNANIGFGQTFFEYTNGSRASTAEMSIPLYSVGLVSKNNQLKFNESLAKRLIDEDFEKQYKEQKFLLRNLEKLKLDFFEVGTIEVEVDAPKYPKVKKP